MFGGGDGGGVMFHFQQKTKKQKKLNFENPNFTTNISLYTLISLFELPVGGSGGAPTRPADRLPERAKIDPSRLDRRSDGLFRPTKSTQDRSKRHFRSTWSTEVARKGLRRAIFVDLRSILDALGVDFAGFSLAFRSSGPIRSKKRRSPKNI